MEEQNKVNIIALLLLLPLSNKKNNKSFQSSVIFAKYKKTTENEENFQLALDKKTHTYAFSSRICILCFMRLDTNGWKTRK